MLPGMRNRQRGLGAFGTGVVLVLFAAGGYYVYKYVMEPETIAAPSCKAQLNSCITNCRKTKTEAPELLACQQACDGKAASCVEPKR